MILSQERRSRYQELQQALEQLKRTVAQDRLEKAALGAEYRKVQQFFANEIMKADSSELERWETPPEQPYLTEIHKQLRLLGTEVTFLQASKRPGTAASRQTGAIARLDTLIGYCCAMLQKNSGVSDPAEQAELKTD